MHLTKQSAVQSSCDPQTREIILPSRDRRYWFGSVIPGRMAAATCVRACWTIPATEFHFDWGNFPTESCLSTPLPLMVGPKNNPTSKKSFTAGRGKSRKSCEWKPQLAGSQLAGSKHQSSVERISQCESSSPTHRGKSGSIDSKSSWLGIRFCCWVAVAVDLAAEAAFDCLNSN